MKTKKATSQHTPTPWSNINRFIYAEGLNKVCRVNKMIDAEFIVRAVNYHEELIKTIRDVADNWDNSKFPKLHMLNKVLAKASASDAGTTEGRE